MTPRHVYDSFLFLPQNAQAVEHLSLHPDSHMGVTGSILLQDLASVVGHHTARSVKAPANPWGVVDVPKAKVLARLDDRWFGERCVSLLAKARESYKLAVVKVSLTVYKVPGVKHEAYELLLHTVGIWLGDGTLYVID